jgi:putative colanic acid biosynthesis UDP-glucose lipid carrier transferase
MRLHAARTEARRPALVIGAGTLGLKVATMLERRSAYGHDFYGYLEDRAPERCPPEVRSRLLGRLEDLPRLIQRAGIRDIYVTLPLGQQPRIMRLMAQLQDSAASVYYVPDVFGVNIIQGRMHNMDGVPVVGLLESPFVGVNGLLKRASDIVLACLILLLIAPVLLLVALGVKRSSPGPIIFKQRRHGLDGEEIIVYKFRSMTTMDNGATVQQATKHDPRITPFGAFIRRTSLDELPQFINVLQGRMSIVGPRPHAVAHNQQYRQLIKSYMVRHKVRPGITGWAQVNGHRGETDTIEKMARRIECDLEYLRNWSLGLDLKIIARTAGMTWFDKKAY